MKKIIAIVLGVFTLFFLISAATAEDTAWQYLGGDSNALQVYVKIRYESAAPTIVFKFKNHFNRNVHLKYWCHCTIEDSNGQEKDVDGVEGVSIYVNRNSENHSFWDLISYADSRSSVTGVRCEMLEAKFIE